MADIFMLKSWMHYEPRQPKGEPKRDGVLSASFKAPSSMRSVMLHLGNLSETADISDEWLAERLKVAGLKQIAAESNSKPQASEPEEVKT